jgi:nucleotide-binding universal stress UspA family protein
MDVIARRTMATLPRSRDAYGGVVASRSPIQRAVVGIDGSPESLSALVWACRAVGSYGTVIAANAVTPGQALTVAAMQGDSADLVDQRLREIDEWVASACAASVATPAIDPPESAATAENRPSASITTIVVEDDPVDALLRIAGEQGADTIIVGIHGQGRLGPRRLGRMATRLLHRTTLPLVIVHDEPDRADIAPTIVAGVGRGAATAAALQWAAEYADSRGAALELIRAMPPRPVFRADGLLDVMAYYIDPDLARSWTLEDIERAAGEIQETTDRELDIRWSAPVGSRAPTLVEASARATLLVLGLHDTSRGSDDGDHDVPGWLRRALVHAPCPVVVVPVAPAAGGDERPPE